MALLSQEQLRIQETYPWEEQTTQRPVISLRSSYEINITKPLIKAFTNADINPFTSNLISNYLQEFLYSFNQDEKARISILPEKEAIRRARKDGREGIQEIILAHNKNKTAITFGEAQEEDDICVRFLR